MSCRRSRNARELASSLHWSWTDRKITMHDIAGSRSQQSTYTGLQLRVLDISQVVCQEKHVRWSQIEWQGQKGHRAPHGLDDIEIYRATCKFSSLEACLYALHGIRATPWSNSWLAQQGANWTWRAFLFYFYFYSFFLPPMLSKGKSAYRCEARLCYAGSLLTIGSPTSPSR